MNSAAVPMATPPARVAFWMCTCQVKRHVSHEECIYVRSQICCFSVNQHYHVQLSSLLRRAGDGHGGEHRGGEGDVGVDGGSVLSRAVVCDGRVETWPEHPQEQCACEVGEGHSNPQSE